MGGHELHHRVLGVIQAVFPHLHATVMSHLVWRKANPNSSWVLDLFQTARKRTMRPPSPSAAAASIFICSVAGVSQVMKVRPDTTYACLADVDATTCGGGLEEEGRRLGRQATVG